MARAGFNPQAAIDLWQDFAESQERSGVEFVEWTSTHPCATEPGLQGG